MVREHVGLPHLPRGQPGQHANPDATLRLKPVDSNACQPAAIAAARSLSSAFVLSLGAQVGTSDLDPRWESSQPDPPGGPALIDSWPKRLSGSTLRRR